MLQPKRTKFRKVHKGRNRGIAGGTEVSFGTFGLKAVGRGRLTARQIEAARRAMTRAVKRQGKIWIRVFPDKPITEKPLEVRDFLSMKREPPSHKVLIIPSLLMARLSKITPPSLDTRAKERLLSE